MKNEQKVICRLREEYNNLLPSMRIIKEQIEAEVRYALLPIRKKLQSHQMIDVVCRIKGCESAIDSLKRRQEGSTFDIDHIDHYSLTNLKDLVGVRVLFFPDAICSDIDKILKKKFNTWKKDHILNMSNDDVLAYKYYGFMKKKDSIYSEYQIVPMLIGLFWVVEHSTTYKPKPEYRGIAKAPEMEIVKNKVYLALKDYGDKFEQLMNASYSVK